MNIAFFGEDVFSIAVLQSLIDNHYTVSVVISIDSTNKTTQDFHHKAQNYGITFLKVKNINSVEVRNIVKSSNVDLIICVHLKRLLREDLFSIPMFGAINIHPSLLPKYRGLSPQHQPLLMGDSTSAVTIHKIDIGTDTGDIIIQKEFPISDNDYIADVQIKMLSIYKVLMIEALKIIVEDEIPPFSQNDNEVSYFGALTSQDYKISLEWSKTRVYNLIRAVSMPYSGAIINNYKVWRAKLLEHSIEKELLKKYSNIGIYHNIETEELIIRLFDGIVVSDDFETLTVTE